MAWVRVPLCAARLLVDGDDGAVDQGVFEVRLIGQAREDALDYAALHPATKTLEDAVPVAEIARQVAPGHARSHAPQHRLKEQPIVFGRRPRIGEVTRPGANFFPHQDPTISSGSGSATSSGPTIRPCAPGDLAFSLNTSSPPAISMSSGARRGGR